MKLQADIEIFHINHASLGFGKKCKSTKSILILCRKNEALNSPTYLILATKKDTSGTKYNIINNIDSIFTKFVHEGKCTIRLKEPFIDLRISKTDPIKLKAFLKILNLCNKVNLPENITLPKISSVNITNKEFKCEQTKLLISSRINYPIIESFPNTLTELIITGIKLTKFDLRIFSLRRLAILDISDNCINELPNSALEWNKLVRLNTLILSTNKITELPHHFLTSCINKTLSLLDISSNDIVIFPKDLWSFSVLKILRLSNNKIKSIPQGMSKESFFHLQLYIDGNQLDYLPYEFIEYKLETLDISNNPLEDKNYFISNTNCEDFDVMSLMEMAARSIRTNKLSYSLYDVSILKSYLDFGRKCSKCKKYIFASQRKNYIRSVANKSSRTFCGPDTCLFEEIICSYCERFIIK